MRTDLVGKFEVTDSGDPDGARFQVYVQGTQIDDANEFVCGCVTRAWATKIADLLASQESEAQ